jgi:hypothetical protein
MPILILYNMKCTGLVIARSEATKQAHNTEAGGVRLEVGMK